MKHSQLPNILYENGKTYFLVSRSMSDDPSFKGWWTFQYSENGNDDLDTAVFPPEATDGSSIYYLISVGPSKKEAKEDLLDRINRMTKIVTEVDKKELEEKWQKTLKKKLKGLKIKK